MSKKTIEEGPIMCMLCDTEFSPEPDPDAGWEPIPGAVAITPDGAEPDPDYPPASRFT